MLIPITAPNTKAIYTTLLFVFISFCSTQVFAQQKHKPKQTPAHKKNTAKKVLPKTNNSDPQAPTVVPQGSKKGKGGKKAPTKKLSDKTDQPTTPLQEQTPIAPKQETIHLTPTDTGMQREVVITSAFKPSLRNSAKIDFTAATPVPDTTRQSLNYEIPAQSLFFSYQPVPLKPLAHKVDTGFVWQNNAYVKAGYGNYSTPYLEGAASFGDGKYQVYHLNGSYVASKGNLPFQEASRANLAILGIFNNSKNIETDAKAYYEGSTQYKYGITTPQSSFTKDQLSQNYGNIGASVLVMNKIASSYGITYKPKLGINYFFDNHHANETGLKAELPINKSFGRVLALDLKFDADKTRYTDSSLKVDNDLYSLSPSLQFKTPNLSANLGITPTWDNKVSNILPNITVESKIVPERLIIQLGWVGNMEKNSFRSLALYNPYIQHPTSFTNTNAKEYFLGLKGSLGKHINYNLKAASFTWGNAPIFLNDTIYGKSQSFLNPYTDLEGIKLHAELGYTVKEKLSILGSVTYTKYTTVKGYDKAFGRVPLEIKGSLIWKVVKDVQFKSDLFYQFGNQFAGYMLKGATIALWADVNAGVEFAVAKKVDVWLEMANLLNKSYEAWHQYPSLGYQILGGIKYRFN